MDAEARIRLFIGEMTVQNIVAQAEIEKLKARVAELERQLAEGKPKLEVVG